MGEYMERLCIFICIAELLGNFLPSEKFAKWYRYMVGIFVLLLLIQPLGEGVEVILEQKKSEIMTMLETERQGTQELWELEDAYLKQLTEEQLAEYLQPYGYAEESY